MTATINVRKPGSKQQVILEALAARGFDSPEAAMPQGHIVGAVQLHFNSPEAVSRTLEPMLRCETWDSEDELVPTPLVERVGNSLFITRWGKEALAKCEVQRWLDPSIEANWKVAQEVDK